MRMSDIPLHDCQQCAARSRFIPDIPDALGRLEYPQSEEDRPPYFTTNHAELE
jgi:hypothetical protein